MNSTIAKSAKNEKIEESNPGSNGKELARSSSSSTSSPSSPRARARRALGAEGETRAATFLSRRGYRIDARNVRYGGVEIDLIARRGPVVAFVEVKTRRSDRHGAPELAVDRRKQARIIRAANAWRAQHPGFTPSIRFDVIAIRVERENGRDRWRIDHLIAAFDAGD